MDTISQMMITIKNGSLVGKETVSMPYSKLRDSIATCLQKEGFIANFSKKQKKGFPFLEIELVYTDKKPKISDVKRISKPSKRVYYKVKDIHPIRNGTGLFILSTPKGILSGGEAKKEQVGGEALFQLW